MRQAMKNKISNRVQDYEDQRATVTATIVSNIRQDGWNDETRIEKLRDRSQRKTLDDRADKDTSFEIDLKNKRQPMRASVRASMNKKIKLELEKVHFIKPRKSGNPLDSSRGSVDEQAQELINQAKDQTSKYLQDLKRH